MFVSEVEFKKYSKLLAEKIKISGIKYHWIICIAKWWFHLTYYLGKLLKINDIQNINIHSYKWHMFGRIRDCTRWLNLKEKKRYLLVDDLMDSWKTIEYINRKYWDFDTAVIFVKWREHNPTYYIEETDKEEWINFYYEQWLDE